MEIQAPAKINLFLQVVGRRQDGYHLLRTLMCCIGLYDTIHIDIGGPADTIACDHPDVPADRTNLALRAALLFKRTVTQTTAVDPGNVAIDLIKRIPAGAGLGGGSSDAAAVLNALNRYYRQPLSEASLLGLALELGADVPFFIKAVPAVATGIGERLTPYPGLASMPVLVVFPGVGLSTSEVFKNLNLRLTKCEKQLRYFPFNNRKFDVARHLCNDLETVAMRRFPVIREIKNELLNQGAIGALMTGSGSAVFGLFDNQAARQTAAGAMRRHDQWQIYDTALIT